MARGKVQDEQGQPIPGARVIVRGRTEKGKPAIARGGRTWTDGVYTVGGLLPGPWTVDVTADGYVPAHDVDPHSVTLVRGGRLRVLVVDAVGLGRAAIKHRVAPAPSEPSEGDEAPTWDRVEYGVTDLDGRAEFVLAPGRWRVTLGF